MIDLTDDDAKHDASSLNEQQLCPICSIQFKSVDDLQAHVEAHFVEAEEEKKHANTHKTDNRPTSTHPLHCSICGLELFSQDDIASHELAHALEGDDIEQGQATDHHLHAQLRQRYGFDPKQRPGRCFTCGNHGHWSSDCPQNRYNIKAKSRIIPNPNPASVAAAQLPDTQQPSSLIRAIGEHAVSHPLNTKEYASCITLLCGHVGHYGGGIIDSSFGCGYRNIQMQLSHVLEHDAYKRQLFGGSGIVPDIASLQAWIEVAWGAGFDAAGAAQLENALQGGKKWIGASEAAALFRYFGIPARIIDFDCKEAERLGEAANSNINNTSKTIGCDGCGHGPLTKFWKSQVLADYDLCDACYQQLPPSQSAVIGPFICLDNGQPCGSTSIQSASRAGRALVEWVWKYFSSASGAMAPAPGTLHAYYGMQQSDIPVSEPDHAIKNSVLLSTGPNWRVESRFTGLPPLYLQHEGHSRTIIGIEKKLKRSSGSASEYSLLLLDPGVPLWAMEQTVLHGNGGGGSSAVGGVKMKSWSQLIKRDARTLNQSQFQIMYVPVEDGVVEIGSEEYESMKVLVAHEKR